MSSSLKNIDQIVKQDKNDSEVAHDKGTSEEIVKMVEYFILKCRARDLKRQSKWINSSFTSEQIDKFLVFDLANYASRLLPRVIIEKMVEDFNLDLLGCYTVANKRKHLKVEMKRCLIGSNSDELIKIIRRYATM